jgi:hypothetical protein
MSVVEVDFGVDLLKQETPEVAVYEIIFHSIQIRGVHAGFLPTHATNQFERCTAVIPSRPGRVDSQLVRQMQWPWSHPPSSAALVASERV